MKVNAKPSKEFFVNMISRDIDINYAIMELIDNCMDGAQRKPEADVRIELSTSKTEFKIIDNCGGMSRVVAREYAFRFGRPSSTNIEPRNEYETGVFGIGMKRALFKMGKKFIFQES
jgi:DNA topoisomerase VI subunit B